MYSKFTAFKAKNLIKSTFFNEIILIVLLIHSLTYCATFFLIVIAASTYLITQSARGCGRRRKKWQNRERANFPSVFACLRLRSVTNAVIYWWWEKRLKKLPFFIEAAAASASFFLFPILFTWLMVGAIRICGQKHFIVMHRINIK